jgi:hypothetical protein
MESLLCVPNVTYMEPTFLDMWSGSPKFIWISEFYIGSLTLSAQIASNLPR